jgi:hypothetical protein
MSQGALQWVWLYQTVVWRRAGRKVWVRISREARRPHNEGGGFNR